MANLIKMNLDTIRDSYETLELMQGYTYDFEFNVTQNGKNIDLQGVTPRLDLARGDGTYVIQTEDIEKERSFVKGKINKTFTTSEGRGKVQLILAKDDEIFGSWVIGCNIKRRAIEGLIEENNIITILDELDKKIDKAVNVRNETEELIEIGGAATKGDIVKINSELAKIVPEQRLEYEFNAKMNYIIDFETIDINPNVSDDTQMLRDMIEKAMLNNDNRVKLPARMIYITSTIVVPRGITIEGDYGSTGSAYGADTPTAYAQKNVVSKQSGTIVVWGSSDITKNVFVLDGAGACIKNLAFLYQYQTKYLKPNIFNINNIKKFAPSIRSQRGNNHRIENIIFYNSYEGVLVTGNTTGVVIRDIWTQTFSNTIILDDTTEFIIDNVNYRCGGHYFGNRNTTIQPSDSAVIKLQNKAGLGFINNLAVNRHNCAVMAQTDWGLTLHNSWIDEVKYPIIITQSPNPSSTGKFKVFMTNVEIGEGCLYARKEYTNLEDGTTSNYFDELNPNPVRIECNRGKLNETRYEYFVEMTNCEFWCPLQVEGTVHIQASNSYFYQGFDLKANSLTAASPIIKLLLSNCVIDNNIVKTAGNVQIYQSNTVTRNSNGTTVKLSGGTIFNEVKSLDSNITIYYDRSIVSNVQDGSVGYPFSTFGRVKSFLPKRVDGDILISVMGDTSETIDLSYIEGNGTITIRGANGNKNVGDIILNGVKCNVSLRDVTPTKINDSKIIRIFNCYKVTLQGVPIVLATTTGLYCENSNVIITGGTISNMNCAVDSTQFSRVLINGCGGTNNVVGYRARNGGSIYLENSTMFSTTQKDQQTTGKIIP